MTDRSTASSSEAPDTLTRERLRDWVLESYRTIAPRRLVAQLAEQRR